MEPEPLAMEAGPQTVAAALRGLVPPPESVSGTVAEIIQRVRREGDAALAEFSERFDTGGEPAPPLSVRSDELAEAGRALSADVARALQAALENVAEVARAGAPAVSAVVEHPDRRITVREEPVQRAAVYVPGGRAPYPSTVAMGVAAARAAGVPEIVVCTPPPAHQVILGACALARVGEVYRMGGAQAIAALAYGTETVRPVDVIVGPGNAYVQEAKRQVSVAVGVDAFAGPSDLMVIVGPDADDLQAIALDLVAQAEHGPGTLVIGVSTSSEALDRLGQLLANPPDSGAVIRLVHVPTIEDAFELAQAFAPEHLQLVGAEPEALAPDVTRAGCVFLGAQTGTAFGDYIVGSNHVLPTDGSARFASGLSPAQFRRRWNEVRILDADALARAAAPLARAEGFELHARSMEARIRENRSG